MTVGSDVQDFRVLQGLSTGVQLVGTMWSREWSGGDAPPPPVYHPVYDPATGQYAKRHGRPPKRGRSKGEHPYTMNLVSRFNPAGSYFSNPNWYTTTLEGLVGGASSTATWTANDDIALLGKLREKITSSSFNAAVSMAEGHQSVELILKAAKTLDTVYRHAKRGDWKSATKALAGYERNPGVSRKKAASTTLSNGWLEYQYGVKPLLNDVYDAATTLAHLSSVPLQQTLTVSRKNTGQAHSGSPTVLDYTDSYSFKAKKIKAVVKEVDVVSLLGLTDPASVAWEKLPYSFVVDWFIPVGNFLSARGLSRSITALYVITYTEKVWANGATGIPQNGLDGYRYRSVHMERTVSSYLDVPLPKIKPLSEMLSWSHATTATTLLVNNHGRK